MDTIRNEHDDLQLRQGKEISPGGFSPDRYFHSEVHASNIHPIAAMFFGLDNDAILNNYINRHPTVNPDVLRNCLEYKPKHFRWAGTYTYLYNALWFFSIFQNINSVQKLFEMYFLPKIRFYNDKTIKILLKYDSVFNLQVRTYSM